MCPDHCMSYKYVSKTLYVLQVCVYITICPTSMCLDHCMSYKYVWKRCKLKHSMGGTFRSAEAMVKGGKCRTVHEYRQWAVLCLSICRRTSA